MNDIERTAVNANLRPIESAKTLLDMLEAAFESMSDVGFIIGSGLTCPVDGHRGVPGCSEIIEIVLNEMPADDARRDALEAHFYQKDIPAAYELAMMIAGDPRPGPLRSLIQRVVAKSFDAVERIDPIAMMANAKNWPGRPGINAIGKLLTDFPKHYSFAITTNFDPLIEMAIRRADGNPTSIVFNSTTGFTFDLGRVPVLHVHGFWIGETMHRHDQLTTRRPTLAWLLQQEFRSIYSLQVVIGYGGWNDNIMQTLADGIVAEQQGSSLHWCLFESGERAQAARARILDRLDKLVPHNRSKLESLITFYEGVDADVVMPELLSRVEKLHSDSALRELQRARSESESTRNALVQVKEELDNLQQEHRRLTAESAGKTDEVERLRVRLQQKDIEISSRVQDLATRLGTFAEQLGIRSEDDKPMTFRLDARSTRFLVLLGVVMAASMILIALKLATLG